MIGMLQRWFARKPQHPACITAEGLPGELTEKMQQRSFSPVQEAVQALLRTCPEALPMLLAAAREQGWPDIETDKLRAYGHFYRGELDLAFNQAMVYGITKDASQPFDADMFMLQTICLYHNAQYESAWQLLSGLGEREAAFAGRADYYSIKSSIAYANNQVEVAWAASEAARHLRPDDALIALNAYALAFRLPDDAVFKELHNAITAGRYGDQLNAFSLSTPVLAIDNYAEGFRLLEGRYGQADAERYVNPALASERRWSGRTEDWPLGRILLVSCEQGLGDTIQMARYFPLLAEMTAGRLVIEAQQELLPLLSAAFPSLHFVAGTHAKPSAAVHDLWIGSMSLPYVFGSTATDIPGRAGYLSVPSENRTYWQGRVAELAESRPRIGITWSGSPGHRSDRQRSIPYQQIVARLSQRPEVDFFALQTSVPAERPANLHDLSAELMTFADTAGLVEQMDLVISVDTSAVHLAGALGHKTWLLLPYRYEWRWSVEGEHNAWYDSVSVVRQRRHGDWEGVLEDVFNVRLPEWLQLQGQGEK